MTERGYQHGYAAINPQMHAEQGRQRKAATMLEVLREALGADRLAQARLLNLGCSAGIIDAFLAPHVGTVLGIDIDSDAVAAAIRSRAGGNLSFRVADAMALDLADASFDIVICSQVYEHVPDAKRLMAEIERVLAPGGVCYFAATNRWAPIEQHYHLPLLSWLPQRVADGYLRLLRRGDRYYEKHLGYFALRRLAREFRIEDRTGTILADPDRYQAGYLFPGRGKRWLARAWFALLRPLFPGYIWLLWKQPRP